MPAREAGPGLVAFLRRLGRPLFGWPAAVAWAGAGAWMAVLWILSSRAFEPGEPGLLWRAAANAVHAPLFGALAVLLSAALLRPRAPGGWPVVDRARGAGVVGLTTLYGVVDEWHQSFHPHRDASALDVLTDAAAAVFVVWIVAYVGDPAAGTGGLWRRVGTGAALCLAPAFAGALL